MTMGRRPLIAGNWKMHGLRAGGLALAMDIAHRVRKADAVACDLVLCPPFTLLRDVVGVSYATGIAVGGQDCHGSQTGAFTGDISAEMLKDAGAGFVIVGHSERRAGHGETSAVVAVKAKAALDAGLVPIICIGETEAEYDAGRTEAVVTDQLRHSVPDGTDGQSVVIAYEPVWAIGSGRTPSNDEIARTHALIRKEYGARAGAAAAGRLRILYGGSVKPANARTILALDDVDGALVGGASLKADDFWAIAGSCP
jgi:triosephosphate isomerase